MSDNKSFRKRLMIICLSCAALCFVGVLLLPSILGSKWVYEPIVARLRAADFQVSIDEVSLSWWSPLKLRGIKMNQADGSRLLEIAEINGSHGILGMLVSGRSLGRVELVRPIIDIRLLEDSSNLQRFVEAVRGEKTEPKDATKKAKPKLDIDLGLVDCSAVVTRDGEEQPLVVIPAFDLELSYRALAGEAVLKAQPTKILDKVELRPELIRLGLAYGVPLLAESAWFDGRISLEIGGVSVPLDNPRKADATGTLTLHQVRSGPSNPAITTLIDLIGRLSEREVPHEFVFVNDSQIAVTVRDGRVRHEGLRVGLPKLDDRLVLSTSGSVGIEDKSLDLEMSVPVPLEQLARRESVQQLGVPTIRIPITGTLDDPTINWKTMRGDASVLLGVIRKQVAEQSPGTASALGVLEGLADGQGDQAVSAAVTLFEHLRERRREQEAAKRSSDPAQQDDKKEPKRPLRDVIKGFLPGSKQKEQ